MALPTLQFCASWALIHVRCLLPLHCLVALVWFGLPTLPFFMIGILLAIVAQRIVGGRNADAQVAAKKISDEKEASEAAESNSAKNLRVHRKSNWLWAGNWLQVLYPVSRNSHFACRNCVGSSPTQYGYVIPEIKVIRRCFPSTQVLSDKSPRSVIATHALRINEVLALIGSGPVPNLPGELVYEPAFGMRAFSVPASFAEDLRQIGLQGADNLSVILTHLSEVIRSNLAQLLSYRT